MLIQHDHCEPSPYLLAIILVGLTQDTAESRQLDVFTFTLSCSTPVLISHSLKKNSSTLTNTDM